MTADGEQGAAAPSEYQDKTTHNTGLQALAQPMTAFGCTGSFAKPFMRTREKSVCCVIKGVVARFQAALLTSQAGSDREGELIERHFDFLVAAQGHCRRTTERGNIGLTVKT